MKKWYRIIIVALFSFCSYSSIAQTNCTVPDSAVLNSVSIQPETGITELKWTLSPSSGIAAYIIYTFQNGDGMPVDTLWDPGITSFTYNSNAPFSLSYVVSALRLPDCESVLSNPISTIFCSSEIDTCTKEIFIRWNSYPDYPKRVLEYNILVYKNEAPLPEMYSVNPQANSFTFTDFETNSRYCFVIRAVLEGGTFSNSNKICLTTKMQRPPQWINSDYATITPDNKISLSYTIDPLSEINRFWLEKKIGSTGSFQKVAELVSDNGQIKYIDNQADINYINYYRLSAVNNCTIPLAVSNLSSNIVLSLNRTGNDINLTWNPYKYWSGTLSAYKLFVNTGDGYTEKAVLQDQDTAFTIGYSEIMYQLTGNEVCFFITALEAGNPYGIAGESRSPEKCTSITENITVPNLFTPDGDLLNDLFKPILSFIPKDYHLIISDRSGKVVFETKDEASAWNGSMNGDTLPQGVYLWFLKVTGQTGKSISKTGTITIFRNR